MKIGDVIKVYIDKDTVKDVVFTRWLDLDTIEFRFNGKLWITHYKNIL